MSWVGVTLSKETKGGQGLDNTDMSMDSNLQDIHLEGDVEHQAVSIGEVGGPARFRHIKNNKYMRRLYLVLAALAAIFVFSSLLRLSIKKKSGDSPQNTPTTTSGSDDIDLSGSSVREGHLIVLFNDISIDDAERNAISDPSSPQRQAIQWISNNDKMNMEIPETRFDASYAAFLQRYSSAVLAFSFGPQLLKPLGFLSEKHECDWNVDFKRPDGSTLTQGLICNPGDDKVMKVVLQTLGLAGSIPMEISNLHFVEHLHLDENDLVGKLPPMLHRLSGLRELTISRNSLSGHLPSYLGKMKSLRHVELSKNSFSGPLSSAFVGLSGDEEATDEVASPLRVLALDNNKLTGPIESLKNVAVTLEELYLNDNALTGHVGDAFKELSHLAILDASKNRLSGMVPDYLLQLDSMTILDLHSNAFTGQFPHGNSSALKYLDLHGNTLASVLPRSIGQHENLAYLDLSYNKLEGSLIDELGELSMLQYLFLSNNPMLDPSPIPAWILRLPILKSLSLKNTARVGGLPNWLGQLTQLTFLDLENNSLNGTIPSSLSDAANLEYLFLNKNSLSGQVPTTVSNLTELVLLNLDHNALSGAIPSGLCQLKLDVLVADCGTPNVQTEPQIECSCCTNCCLATADDCNSRDWSRKYGDDWGGYYERYNIVDDGDVYEMISEENTDGDN